MSFTVMSVLDYKNLRLGSQEEHLLELTRQLRAQGGRHIVVLR